MNIITYLVKNEHVKKILSDKEWSLLQLYFMKDLQESDEEARGWYKATYGGDRGYVPVS